MLIRKQPSPLDQQLKRPKQPIHFYVKLTDPNKTTTSVKSFKEILKSPAKPYTSRPLGSINNRSYKNTEEYSLISPMQKRLICSNS